MTALASTSSNCKQQIRSSIKEGTPPPPPSNLQLTAVAIWSWALDGCSTPIQSGRLTVGRNKALTLTLILLHN
jgi:hypothetical protein